MTDVVDTALGLAAGDPVHDLRRERPDVVTQLQRAHDLLFLDLDEAATLSLTERSSAALRVATAVGSSPLAAHYRALLDNPELADAVLGGETGDSRLDAIVAHARRSTVEPKTVTQADLLGLQDYGLTVKDVVTLSQLIAFVNFQLRVVAGLDAMKG
jgi:uncharacterized protein YciW